MLELWEFINLRKNIFSLFIFKENLVHKNKNILLMILYIG